MICRVEMNRFFRAAVYAAVGLLIIDEPRAANDARHCQQLLENAARPPGFRQRANAADKALNLDCYRHLRDTVFS